MADTGGFPDSIEELKAEITRLQNELSETSREKVQAAEYGLAVLEERQQVQAQYDELESLFETTRHELECAKEVCISRNAYCRVSKLVGWEIEAASGV